MAATAVVRWTIDRSSESVRAADYSHMTGFWATGFFGGRLFLFSLTCSAILLLKRRRPELRWKKITPTQSSA